MDTHLFFIYIYYMYWYFLSYYTHPFSLLAKRQLQVIPPPIFILFIQFIPPSPQDKKKDVASLKHYVLYRLLIKSQLPYVFYFVKVPFFIVCL